MGQTIVIGTPPLGEQEEGVLVAKMTSGNVVIQTPKGWVTIEGEHVLGVAEALLKILGD